MINLKVSGIIAITAFFLSFVIGLASRTAMPMLLVRAIVFAVLFFVLTAMIHFMVSRFLPELLAADSANNNDIDFLMPGSQVNIMEGDSAEPSSQGDNSSSPSVPLFMGAQADDTEEGLCDISDLSKTTPASAPGGGIQSIGLAGMDQNAQDGYNEEGNLEELPESDQFTPWEPPRISTGASLGTNASVPEKTPGSPAFGETPVSSKSRAPIMDAADTDSEDFFPDLDSMAGAFIPTPTSEGSETSEYSGSSSSRRSRRNKDAGWAEDFNAKDMAAGLRTVLNKEKEG